MQPQGSFFCGPSGPPQPRPGSEGGICSLQPRETLLVPEGPRSCRAPLVPTPVLPETFSLASISAVALAACLDMGGQEAIFPPRAREGVRTARQDSFHLGPSALTPEPWQPPPSCSLSPCSPNPSVHSPHFYQSAISNNAILVMSLSCSKFFSRSPWFQDRNSFTTLHGIQAPSCFGSLVTSHSLPLAPSPCNFHLAPTEQ